MAVIYEWDRNKAKANLTKRGISFTAAAKALYDPYRLEELDLSARTMARREVWYFAATKG